MANWDNITTGAWATEAEEIKTKIDETAITPEVTTPETSVEAQEATVPLEPIQEWVVTTEAPTTPEVAVAEEEVTPTIEEPVDIRAVNEERRKREEEIKRVQALREEWVAEPDIITRIEEERKAPVIAEKVETAEDIKTKQLAIKETETAQQEEANRKALTSFTQAIDSGNLDLAKELSTNNPSLRGDFTSIVKSRFKQKSDVEFFKKYNWATNDEMRAAAESWALVIWSEQYNSLPEAQRRRFEQFNKLNITKKTDFTTDNNNVLSLDAITNNLNSLFSFDLRKKLDEAKNNPELKSTREWLESLQNEINEIDDELDILEEDVRSEFNRLDTPTQNAIIRRRRKDIVREKNTLINQYNAKLGTYNDLKWDLDREVQIAQFEDSQQRQLYTTALQQYNTDRARMDKIALLEFQEQSKIQAENRANAFKTTLIENEREYQAMNKKWVYQTDRNGNLLYLVDWKANPVLSNTWEVVWITKQKWFSDTVSKNKEGWFEVLRMYDDWRKPDFFSYWVNWQNNLNTNINVQNWISAVETYKSRSKTPWYQCWEAVNNYLNASNVTWIRMGDTYKSKQKYINSQTPKVWGLAVWNPTTEGTYWENGHVWIVSWYNPSTWMVEITDWNAKWDGKKNIYSIPVSQISNSDGGFVDLSRFETQKEVSFSISDLSVFNSLTASEKAKRQNDPQFKAIVEAQNKVFTDPNADPFEVIAYSKWWKDMSATDNKEIRKFSAVLNSLWEIQETITEWTWWMFWEWTWPFVWLLRSKDPYDVTAQKLKAQITSLIPNLARWVYWEVWVLTEADVELYRQTVPNLTQTEDVNRAMLGMTLRLVKRWLETNLTDLARSWVDTSWFEWKLRQINKELEVIEWELQWKVPKQSTKASSVSVTDAYASYQNKKVFDWRNFNPNK